jgi:DNA-3-methyladenine glycosylase
VTRPAEPAVPLPAAFYDRPGLEVARDLLGREVRVGPVAVRLTEVEAYAGLDDPGSHAYRGPTPRTGVMFGPPGHAYVYFSYGMHWCMNLVCGPAGQASAVLLRAGDLQVPPDEDGATRAAVARLVAERRPGIRPTDLARGPARLTKLLGIDRDDDGADVTDPAGRVQVLPGTAVPDACVRTGPRIGLSAGADRPWRFWVEGAAVSSYRAGQPRRRTRTGRTADGSRDPGESPP